MKLHFEPDLDYQWDAINAICDLFRGQEICCSEFTVSHPLSGDQHALGIIEGDLGVGNRLTLHDDELLANLRTVQERNALPPASSLDSGDFTVEMETGTGKTYVYLRTIFELNRRYGFMKFVVVVPSIAIKEGVYKTLQMTEEHFKSLYAGVPSSYFLYDSSKLGQVRTFATSANIQIMVVTVGAINKKDINNLYRESEKTGDERPVDLIRATNPIIIVDEPQSVDGGLKGAGKKALAEMNPLCTLRYSATHVDKYHMVYRLDAVAAYERKLVKQIEVASGTVEEAHNRPFVQLVAVASRRGDVFARVVVDIQRDGGVRREEITVHDGDDLEMVTHRALYRNYRIGELRAARGAESLELCVPGDGHFLAPGEAWGGIDARDIQRHMIRRTIREHLDKELQLRPRGIKTLSLFFIDAVNRYRSYDAAGNPEKGAYAKIFEEEYRRLSGYPEYRALANLPGRAPNEVHDGYFSIDKKGRLADTDEGNQADRDSAEHAYNLIMRDKEKLLSLETPLAFIFSHSALKEGWDNPNVFQICTLRDIHGETERRQTIGRGLRLCVDQNGDRIRGFYPNTLTVIANESYEQFAAGLQREMEDANGIMFTRHLTILDAEARRRVKPRRELLLSPEFKSLWDRVKYKTIYRVEFDNEQLINECIRGLRYAPPVPHARVRWRKANLAIGKTGVEASEGAGAASDPLRETDTELPDILTELQDRTHLTRKTIQRVLAASGRLREFGENPQAFIEMAADAVNKCKRAAIVNGIRYRLLGDDHYYAQELLDQETVGYVRRMIEDSGHKSVYDHILYESEVEAEFAKSLEYESAVKLFTKLPSNFIIQTPLGPYNPDWAVVIEQEGRERMYFIAETKGSASYEDLRGAEAAKIECGRAHFEALRVMESPARYEVVTTVQQLLDRAELQV